MTDVISRMIKSRQCITVSNGLVLGADNEEINARLSIYDKDTEIKIMINSLMITICNGRSFRW